MKSKVWFALYALAATVLSVPSGIRAEGESLAETGGYVPTSAPALAFKDVTLADLGVTYFPSVSKGGGWPAARREFLFSAGTRRTMATRYPAFHIWRNGSMAII